MTIAFWVICAPFLFPVIVLELARALFSIGAGLEAAVAAAEMQRVWLTVCVAGALQFAALSAWLSHIGAGPFAGQMRSSAAWILAALVIGPFLLLVPTTLVSLFISTEEGWQFSGDVDTALFEPANWTLGYLVFGALIAPIVEEVTFRGVAMGAMLARGVSPAATVVLSSLAFALIHMQYSPAAMSIVFMTGIGLAILRLVSGTMIVPIVAHMAANANMLILQSLASGAAT